MNYLNRAIERELQRAIKTFKAVLVTGARQVGKSTLLRNLFPSRRYVSLDDPFLEEQAKNDSNAFLLFNSPPITIDEIQRAPILFRYLKMRCDEAAENGLFCLSGSQQFHLMKGVSETMSGRVYILELSGLSLRELNGDPFGERFVPTLDYVLRRRETAKPPQDLWQIIHRGSYPGLLNPDVSWESFFGSYIKTYLERDLRELSAVHDLDTFRRFMIAVAARTGSILNYSNIADEIGKDVNTVKKWIAILEASGIIYLLEPYANQALKRAIKTPKLYFRDTGLACYLTRWVTKETLAYGAMAGNIFETFVVSEILKSFSNNGLDYRHFVCYYRGKDKKATDNEIDLIIEENGILYPIEIKMTGTPKANYTAAFQILDDLPDKKRGTGAVLCLCSEPGVLRENVMQIPLWYI
ncbi:MAG: ATP-binding protein [bacterium]|nr:ATP-binding protein [bacterium]